MQGFTTGDIVRDEIPNEVKAGALIGRVAVWHTESFNIQALPGEIQYNNDQLHERIRATRW